MWRKLKTTLKRWRQLRRERHIEARERRVTARENLRDFKRSSGHEGGVPGGGF